MERKMFFCGLKPVLVLSFVCSFSFTAAAQNYYPAEVGNTWVLENADVEERRTYSLEEPETVNGTEVITLKIEIEELSTDELVDTDKYFLTVGSEAIKLHGTVFEEATIGGTVTADFPTPATFFPLHLELGDQWQIVADAVVKLNLGLEIAGKSTTNLEVVGFETLETPAGTFQNCAKVELALQFSAGGFINIDSTTYQWLAPDVGPVQYQNSDGLIFKLVRTNLPTEPDPHDVNADGVVNILDLTFVAARFGEMDAEADVTGDGLVNILDLVRIAQNLSN
ncbi:MAG: dockerin type I domain-containing protein [Candidatus Poribacteria bacterium]|nr:dockerin type I domain-containing protein [Candidatus Poribacteria bacterium]